MLTFIITAQIIAQENSKSMKAEEALPYASIPAHPESYTPEDVAARMIDGLGFRYYWATEGLKPEDLAYDPGNEGRTTDETLDHIYDLTVVIGNMAKKIPTDRSVEKPVLSYEEIRRQTLENLKTASDLLKAGEGLDDFKVLFKKGGEITEKPFWYIINGMITDAIGHTGQIVSFRRSSGNPIPKGVNYFSGQVSD